MGWRDELATVATQRGPALVGYAYLLCGDLTRANDLVQEALARAWARPGRARGPQATEAYVRRAVLTIFLDEQRRATSWARRRHLVAGPATAPDSAARTDDELDVQEALVGLSPRERACVVLRYYDDLTVPALAERLGLSEGTVKRYLSDGLGKLEAALGPVAPTSSEQLTVRLTEGERR